MKLSIAICTRNRAKSLRTTLQSISRTRVPSNLLWEVLVINNNSTDETDLVIDSFMDRLPIRRLSEPKEGLSCARNTAVAASHGEYIVWTDDDVIVSPSWIAAYYSAFERWPNAVLFGGPIRPVFEESVPRWLQQGWSAVPSAFAAVDLGNAPVAFSVRETRIPYGANFAIRRIEQLENPYNPELGPGRRYYHEETTVIIRMLNRGGEGWWVPDAAVDHIIPRARMSVQYLSAYYEKIGRTNYYLDSQNYGDTEIRFFGRPRWIWRAMIENELKYRMSRAFCSPERWLPALRARAIAYGAFKESGTLRRINSG